MARHGQSKDQSFMKIISWPKDKQYATLVLCLALLFLALTTCSILGKSLTYDEPQHYRYGKQILRLNSDRFDDSKMPFSALNALVSEATKPMIARWLQNEWQLMSIGRMATIAFSLGLGFLVLLWSSKLYGKWVGLVSFSIYIFEPNILAHSRLITTDIYAAGTITLSLFLYWRFLEQPNVQRGLLAAAALGLAQIAKYSGLLLIPLFLVFIPIHHYGWLVEQMRQKRHRTIAQAILITLGYGLLFLLVFIFIINLGFLFTDTGIPFGEISFHSNLLQTVQNSSKLLQRMPTPFPYPYLQGFDLVLFNERSGENYSAIYLLGELREGRGFPGYFLIASLFKIPIPILLLFAISLWDYLKPSANKQLPRAELYLIIPLIYFGLYFNFFFRAQIGIRYVLVTFPILLIFSTRVLRKWSHFSRAKKAGFVLLGMYLIVSVVSYYPHYLSYFNELVLDRKQAYKILADSNLDWGQNKAALSDFLSKHHDVIFEPTEVTDGLILVGVNELTGVLGDPKNFAWLRENYDPIDHLCYTYLLFEVPRSQPQSIKE